MIKQIDINEIPVINHGYIMDDIEEFYNSGSAACEIIPSEKRSPDSLYQVYYSAAKKAGYAIKVMRRKNRVFLVRKETI